MPNLKSSVYCSRDEQIQKMSELYLSNTFQFSEKSVEEFAIEYVRVFDAIRNAVLDGSKDVRKEAASQWVNVTDI